MVAAAAQEAVRLPEVRSYGDKIEARIDLRFGKEAQQRFDIYQPAGATKAPVIVCWFGGAFFGSDKSQLERLAAYFASRGFVAITPNYFLGERNGGRAAWPRAVYDAKAAVRFVRAHATELNVDPDRIHALGYSSGAYLAMMVGFTPNSPQLEGPGDNPYVSSRVSAVVEIAGVCDRRRDVGLPLALLGEGYRDKWDLRVATSPVIYISSNTVPVYILHGRQDSVVEVSCAAQLSAALKIAGVPHVVQLVDADHTPVTLHELDLIAEWLEGIK